MKKTRFHRLFGGFYEQYLIIVIFMAITPQVFHDRMLESILAITAIALGTLADITINRVYDADDDAIEEWKSKTNPISNGEIGKDLSWMVCVNIYFISIILSLLTGDIIFSFALVVRNLIGFLYSGPPIRAKSSPFIDMLFHPVLIDAGPAFMALMYTRNFTTLPVYLLGFLVLNSLFTQISQEIRDLSVDRKAGLDTTVQRIGRKKAQALQRLLLVSMGLYVVVAGLQNSMNYITWAAAIAIVYITKNILGDYRVMHKTRRNSVAIMLIGALVQVIRIF